MDYLKTILESARAQGFSQKVLASRAGVPEETLSRFKNRSGIKTDTLEKLAAVVSLKVGLVPAQISSSGSPARRPFVEKYKSLVWSNPEARAEIFIRKALLRPDYSMLLDAAEEFGVPKLVEQWRVLESEVTPETTRAAPVTKRMLTHLGARL